MARQYFRKKDPAAAGDSVEWLPMTGEEFYRFVTSPEGAGRYFIDMEDVVIEASEEQYRQWEREKDHDKYLRRYEKRWQLLSLNLDSMQEADVDVCEESAMEQDLAERTLRTALWKAVKLLDADSFKLIHSLFFAEKIKTEQELAGELGISQVAVSKRKKKILENLKLAVIESEKSSQ